MIIFCNSKINLGLDIVARRDDGYHDIVTAMLPIEWGDVIEIVPSHGDDARLFVSGRQIDCAPEKNLVMRAYRALSAEAELPPVDIYLRKIVPDGAGLGGGSSDAAHTLLLLNRMFSLGFSHDKLAEVASSLGADCPFFIYNRPMLATGIGTDLSPVELSLPDSCVIVVVKPPVSVPTARAYSGVSPRHPAIPLPELLERPIEDWRWLIKNDFEESIFPQYPLVAQVKDEMYDAGAIYASMSGSGSAVYGIFRNDNLSLPARWGAEPEWALWQSGSQDV